MYLKTYKAESLIDSQPLHQRSTLFKKIPSEFQENSLLPKVPPLFQKSRMRRFQMQKGMRMTRWRRAFPRVGQINRWNNER